MKAKIHNSAMPQQQQDEYKGEPLEAELANGPMEKRSCTDPLCCLFFVAFLCGMIGVSAYSLSKGNPSLIGRGYDTDSKMCGISEGYEDYPYLYWPIPVNGYLAKTVCVKECPSDPAPTSVDCKTNSAYTNCIGTNNDINVIKTAILGSGDLTGSFFIYDTVGFVDRFCVPSKLEDVLGDAADTIFNSDMLEQWISDIRETWEVLVCSFGIAFLLGLVYMLLLRYCSGVLTWGAILAFIGGTAVLGWLFYQKAEDSEEETAGTSATEDDDSNVSKTISTERAVAYLCWAVAVISVLAVLCLFTRIRLAIAIIKAAADYVKETPSAMLLPIVTVVVLCVFYGYWGLTAVYLISSGDASRIGDSAFGTFTFDKNLQRLLIYHLFGLLWFNAFVIAATQFVLASSTCLWYFSQGTGQGAKGTIRKSIHRLLRYHFGSIAFGSLILAIIQFIRLVLAYMQQQAKKLQGKEGRIVKFVLGCLQCYMACFERFVKFLNKNAYIQMALSGKNFCASAKDAFFLILRNPLRFGVVGGIGSIFVLFGKVFVASITSLIGFLVITKWDRFSDELYSPFIPTFIMFVFAYAIGAVFMTVYGLASDAILACFVVDEELSKQKNAPPRHCPESLKSFLNKNKKN
jgi:choline transporter-like protein 2/4/5